MGGSHLYEGLEAVPHVRAVTKVFCALGSAVVLAGLTAPVVASAITAPADSTAVSATPIPTATAANRADTAYDDRASHEGATIPIVTVETTANGPKIVSTDVSSSAQASSVAKNAARGNDLVAVAPDNVVHAMAAASTDIYAPNQWALDSAKTSFAAAWKVTTGKTIIVAVVDTGVDAKHQDLAGQVLAGQQFLNGSTDGVPVNPMSDTCGHGTHVAGIIAALANNNRIGIAGAAPGVKILPVRVLGGAKCGGFSSDVANGVIWATNHGARVINLSVGGPGPDAAMTAAVNYARSKKVVVVAAAGNNQYDKTCNPGGTNQVSYPGASAGVIGVGAITPLLQRACFSNVGTYVDLVAPGTDILSTYPFALTAKGYPPYRYMSGTSMATPYVSSAAALVLSRKLSCTPDQVEKRLKDTARRIGTGVPNTSYGYGLVDPAKAVSALAC